MLSLKIGLACALALEAVACSSPLASTHDAGRDAFTPHDATSEGHNVDASVDLKYEICPQPLCTSDSAGSCGQTWAEVLAQPPTCLGFWLEYRGTCGPYNVDRLTNVDVETIFYFDASTGQEVAIYSVSDTGVLSCSSGPPKGISCGPSSLTNVCLQDAGTDARD